jgi:hypothetical protein
MPPSPRYASGGGPSIARQQTMRLRNGSGPSRSRRGSTAEGPGNTGLSGPQGLGRSVPGSPGEAPPGFLGILRLARLPVPFRTLEIIGARMDGERDRTTVVRSG